MKNYLLFFLLLPIYLFSQSNYEISLLEKKAFESGFSQPTSLLETNYIPKYYRLEINSNPDVNEFSGTSTVHFTTTSASNQFQINAKPNLNIESVIYHETILTDFNRENDVLTITLPDTIPTNTLDSISIAYSGDSSTSEGYTRNSHNGENVTYTLSEPWHASTWWVCKDDLLDKVEKLDVYVTHPTELKAASNGTLLSVTNLGNGNSRTHWQHNYPIPTYLVAIAVTNYVEYNNSVNVNGTEVPIINYLYPESVSEAQSNLDLTPSYISSISENFGEYPYKLEKYGHAEWEWGGGMEHATMSFMGGWSQGLIKHELGHQWFGDKVTCGTWSDIWLNEGFAEYLDGWLEQELETENDFTLWKQDYVWYVTDENGGSVWNPEPDNEDRIFNYRLTYAKASMMVHLIRYILNDDELFFQSMREYLDNQNQSYGFATTEDLKSSLESSTNLNWDEYFQDWIYGQGHPIFNISVNGLDDSFNISVQINQTQSHNSVEFFETPFEIDFFGNGGESETRKFYLTENNQTFFINDLPFEVTDYTFNPRFDVVCRVNSETLNNEELNDKPTLKAKIYPNPAQNYFFVETDERLSEIKVFDMQGRAIQIFENLNSEKLKINSTNWPSGSYLLQIKTGNRTQLMKVLVK